MMILDNKWEGDYVPMGSWNPPHHIHKRGGIDTPPREEEKKEEEFIEEKEFKV